MEKNNTSNKIKILITGGHLTPAIAVIEQLKKDRQWEVVFIGRKYTRLGRRVLSYEVNEIPKLKVKFIAIPAGKITRYFSIKSIISVLQIPIGFISAFWHIFILKPDILLLFGGYVAVPVAFAGKLLGIPIVTHEQTVTKGLANTVIEKFSKKIAVSWQESQDKRNKKIVLTGNPIRDVIIKGPGKKVPIRLDKVPLIYITGGSQGSKSLNKLVAGSLAFLTEKYTVVHQCGTGKRGSGYRMLNIVRQNLPSSKKEGYLVRKWFSDEEVSWLLRNADLVISRAGANIITELALIGKKALLIPLPKSARDEQYKNALMLKESGTAEILTEDKITSDYLLNTVESMLKKSDSYESNYSKVKELVNVDAARKLIDLTRKVYEEEKSRKKKA
jgi:UDP-N-acetylglucosamine--N-acetylmuramyl-(pentapeptide) pyrophosphoryl-undecaprenol N-acetylglucosamine transferase